MNGKSIFDEYNPATASPAPSAPVEENASVNAAPTPTQAPSAPVQAPATPVQAPSAPVQQPVSSAAPVVQTPQPVSQVTPDASAPIMEELKPDVEPAPEVKSVPVEEGSVPSLSEADSGSDVPAPPSVTESNNPILEPPVTDPAFINKAPESVLAPPEEKPKQPEVVVETRPEQSAPEPPSVLEPPAPVVPEVTQSSAPVPEEKAKAEDKPNQFINAEKQEDKPKEEDKAKKDEKPKKEKKKEEIKKEDLDILVMSYIGIKYDKFKRRIFNFAGFFFTSLYLFYRKMFWLGIFVFLGTLAISLFVKIPGLFFAVNLLVGLTVNKIYIAIVKRRVKKIKNKNQHLRMDDIKEVCSKKGGSSFFKVILGIILELILTVGSLVAILFFGVATMFGDLLKQANIEVDLKSIYTQVYNYIFNREEEIEEYNGSFTTNKSIVMLNEFSIEVPGKFDDESLNYEYEYSYANTSGVFNKCSFNLSVPKGYSDAEKLINQMFNYYSKNSEPTDVVTKEANNVIWYMFSFKDSMGETYYYGTTKNKKVYLFRYEINEDAPSGCAEYRETVFNSIKSK